MIFFIGTMQIKLCELVAKRMLKLYSSQYVVYRSNLFCLLVILFIFNWTQFIILQSEHLFLPSLEEIKKYNLQMSRRKF